MNFDRNTVIGFVLLALLLFTYLFISTKNSRELQSVQQHRTDSLARVQFVRDSIAKLSDTAAVAVNAPIDSNQLATRGAEQLTVVENEVVKISFTNKGGQPAKVELKKYKSLNSNQPALLNSTPFDKISYGINTGPNQPYQVADLYFKAPQIVRNADNSQTVIYQLPVPNQGMVTHQYTIRPDDYLIDWTVQFAGADKLLTQGNFNLVWQNQPMQHETDVIYERQQSTICYYEENSFDYVMSKSGRTFEKPVQWVSVSQQFFNTTLIAKNKFTSGEVKWTKKLEDTSAKIAEVSTALQARLPLGPNADFPMSLYYGPNDYSILKKHRDQVPEMDKIVNLGRDMYAFVRPINKYIVMPVFGLFRSFIGSLGIAIALLTLFIRLFTSPLVYTSYLSGAKMKALRPEIEKLKEKLGGDQQAVGVEQMKLFREAGVNPLGGCIPALLQIPIFFALYSFFNSNIALRGVGFLWADNLASYDIIVRFGFNIWGLGNHLSLFTLTAVTTSFLISIYNMNMTPDQNNPALKYMPYIFPFILLFVFNRLPAALTWYYTVSNIITLLLQFVIQNYIIDHDKILAKIELNRKKPKGKSKWQERLEQMQEAQQKAQTTREKGGQKK